MAKEWYILHTRTGQEAKVRDAILRQAQSHHLLHHIGQILIPQQETQVQEQGKVKRVTRRVYPRYIFIEMDYSPTAKKELCTMIRAIPGVLGLIGGWDTPAPLSDDEASEVQRMAGVLLPAGEVNLQPGDTVRILTGPFTEYTGIIRQVEEGRGRVQVAISLFGREVPVEISVEGVQKI